MNADLDSLSVLLIWTAIAIYAAAFIAYAFDLARRSQLVSDARLEQQQDPVAAAVPVGAAVGSAGSAASSGASNLGSAGASEAVAKSNFDTSRQVMARIGTVLTALGFLFQLVATVLRGIAAERVPWSNLYEFAMTGTLLIVAVFLVVLVRVDVRYLGTFVLGLVLLLLGGATMSFYVEVVPLADPLKSVWLVIHVFVASLSTAVLALAAALSILQLMQSRRERLLGEGLLDVKPRFLATLPASDSLEGLAYRFATIGFIFWTFTLMAGSIWAQDAWGRYWGFDVKETWTFVVWVLYAGYIHARATRGWRGNRSAWLSIVGFSALLFNFTIVNVFFKGLHAYSGIA